MSDQVVGQKLTLPFGDVIKRVAYAIHSQLQNVLHNMRIQSPELRTQSLISFISRSKKKLAQLLAITRWLDIPAVALFFANMSQLQSKIAGRENRLNENQDALYFTHSQLFCCRIRSLDVVSAKDILARGAYPHLPASMFQGGTAHHDSHNEGGMISDSFLHKSLNIFLRSKVTLRDHVPSDIDQSSIDNGLLTMKVNNMYELILTLDYLDTDAPWNILKFSICVSSHLTESFHSRQNLSAVENSVLLVLRRITTALNSTPAEMDESVIRNDQATASSIDLGSVLSGDIDVHSHRITDDSPLVSHPSTVAPSFVQSPRAIALPALPRLLIICQHAANASALRYLYIQALETSRSILTGLGEAEFQEKTRCSQFVFRFWSSRVTGYYKYELRVIQLRSPAQIYSPLDIEIVVVDSYGKEIGGDVGLAADCRNFSRDCSTASASTSSCGSGSSSSSSSSSSSNSSSSNSGYSNINRRSGVEGSSDVEELPESLSPPCQAPKLIVELWTLSAPDDSDGSSRITRRRVRQKSILAGTADPTASTGSGSGSSSASTASSSEEVSPSATVNETFSDTKIVGHNSCLSEEAESLFDVSEFITNGVTFGGMFHRIIEMSGENMLSVLYHRFLNTPGIMTYILTKQVTIYLEPSRLIIAVGEVQLAVYVDSMSGTFCAGSSLFDCVTKGASKDLSLFLSEINNVESEQLSALYHTSALVLSADVLTSTSSSLTALDTATDDGSTDSGSAISRYVRPLSTASGLVQHLTAAYWAGIMKRVISTQNDEAHATVLYNAAVLQCAADNVTPNDTFRKMDVQSTDTTSSSRTIPLVYELCVWVSPADHNNAHLNCEQQLDQDFSFASFDRIMSTYFHRASVAVESDSATPSAFQLRDCLDTATILRLRSASALIANTVTKDNAHEVLDKIDGAHYVPSQISLMFSFAVDDSLCPHAYALLCQRQAGGTVFLPPTVLDALRLALPKVWSDSNSLKDNTGYNDKYDKLMLSWIENSLSTSLSWARGYLSSTEKLNAFGLYVPVVNSSSPTHDIATLGNTSNIISKRSTVVLWSDAESLITIQLGNDINSSRIDDDVLHISLLCPIPLPGVGTLGVSGPPRCTVGLPRNVTSEEEDRIKRRCISIGELSLTIARVAEKKIDQIVHSRKRQRRVPSSSYFFCCGQLSHLKAFTEASGLIPTDLYSTLAREILQHAFKRHPFSPSQPTHSSEVLPLSLSLEAPIAEDSNREDVLSALSSAYCSVRPLLEFVLLVSSYTSASDSSAVASASTNGSSSKSSSNGAIGRKNILKIISLDCQSRCEPFIVCALYSIADNSRGVGSTSTSTSTSTSVHSESAIEAPLETLLGFIEVEIVRSSIETKETLDTPHTPIDRTRSDSTVADDQISRKTDKINLKVSGISVDFENQIIEMAIFRECFQKKFQAMTGRNPFHAFVNKLVSSISIKTS